MSSAATKKKPEADTTPRLANSFIITELSFGGPLGPLSGLDGLEISFQPYELGGIGTPIFGSARRLYPLTCYAIMNGTVSPNMEVSFELVIDGYAYLFSGVADSDGSGINNGTITSPGSVRLTPGTEDGSWSAQATGGTGEEEEKRRPNKHTKRASR
jgi:hypothetical protein